MAAPQRYPCLVCEQVFTEVRNLKRHVKNIHAMERYVCSFCNKQFTRIDNMH
ncbi:unnamed protein product, partial [Candidula unifasciata]